MTIPLGGPTHDTSSESEYPFRSSRLQSSSSQQQLARPKQRRQLTMPIQRDHDAQESRRGSVARSRWKAAARGLRFPLRRAKAEPAQQSRGGGVVTTLIAGAPAANLLASHMAFDEHSRHHVPVVVDLLKVSLAQFCVDNRLIFVILSICREGMFHIALICNMVMAPHK